jgi:ribosomal-protein-alanine N-acetyltransferase
MAGIFAKMISKGDYILETERMLFRWHIADDLDAFCAMEMDADVRKYVGGYPRTREEAERRFTPGITAVDSNLIMCATIYKPENKYIGHCGIYPHFNPENLPVPGGAVLGLYIAKAYWGRGLATEAGWAFIDYGFNLLKLNRIVTMVQTGNDASVRVIEKLGFTGKRRRGRPQVILSFCAGQNQF